MSLKILHLHNYYGIKGGAEIVFRQTAKGIEKLCGNCKNYIVHSDTEGITQENHFKLNGRSEKKGFWKIVNYLYSIENRKKIGKIIKVIEPDIIHIHNVITEISSSVVHIIKKYKDLYGYKVIHTLHDFFLGCPNYYLYNFRKSEICQRCIGKNVKIPIFYTNCEERGYLYTLMKGINSIIYNNIIKYRDAIDIFIVPSKTLKRGMIKDRMEKDKIKVIPNPVVIEDGDNSIDFNKKKGIVYFGRLSKEKNLSFLIETYIEMLKEGLTENLTIIGSGNELKEIEEKAGNFLNKEIEIIPFMERNRLHKILREKKIFVLPSRCVENFPISVIEAISLGIIPVVAYAGGGAEMIEYFEVGEIFEPYDKNSLKKAIKNTIKNYNRKIPSLKKATKKCNDFSLDIYIKKIMDVYCQK